MKVSKSVSVFILALASIDAFALNYPANLSSLQCNRRLLVDASATTDQADGSEEKPYASIKLALNAATSGDCVLLKSGVYFESISIRKNNVKLAAAKFAEPVVSGLMPVNGWEKVKETENGVIFSTKLNFRPQDLYSGYISRKITHYPQSGWLQMPLTTRVANGMVYIKDPSYLKNGNLVGASVMIYAGGDTNSVATVKITSHDSMIGEIGFPQKDPDGINSFNLLPDTNFSYILTNVPNVQVPGEWMYRQSGENEYTLYYKTQDQSELSNLMTIDPRRSGLLSISADDVLIQGLTFFAARTSGLLVSGNRNVIEANSFIYSTYSGVSATHVNNFTLKRNIFIGNGNAININGNSSAVDVVENEISYTLNDGFHTQTSGDERITDVKVRANYFHHQTLPYTHPDNIQVWGNVRNLSFEDNYLTIAGQQLYTAKGTIENVLIRNNVLSGSLSNSVLPIARFSSEPYIIENNVITGATYSSFTEFLGGDFSLRNNFFGDRFKFSYNSRRWGFNSDHNAFRKTPIIAQYVTLDASGSSSGYFCTGSLAEWIKLTTFEQNSIVDEQDSLLTNMPKFATAIDNQAFGLQGTDTLYVKQTFGFQEGDWVEINQDGILRQVVAVGKKTLQISPALAQRPFMQMVIENWKQRPRTLLRDSRVPAGQHESEDFGSSIILRDFMTGKFQNPNRVLPLVPSEIKGLPNPKDPLIVYKYK